MKKVNKIEKKLENKKEKSVKKKVVKRQLVAKVYDPEGKEKGTVELPKEMFSVTASKILLAQYVRVYLANQRQGTQSTKTRGEVAGSTRKIYRQKGTGRARHGDIKAPIFIGGGIAHGPKPRDLSLKINKKQRQKALFYSLSEKLNKGEIIFVEDLLKIEPKTKHFVKFLVNLKLDKQKRILLIYRKESSKNLILAARNLRNVDFCEVESINAYQILKSRKIIFAKEALPVLIRLRSGSLRGLRPRKRNFASAD